ncbi:MAG: sulfatase [Candidatus Competibacteraceae bacterium]|nr:sulfatase [Candidatus Competibacteraceae bacterium]
MMTTQPNILYFHTHDTGRYISPYGYSVPTPNYQRLAEEGMTFKHMHSVAPTCSPSRAALLTGQYPHQCGMITLAHKGAELNDMGKHLIHTLQPAGYHTALIGFHHEIDWPNYADLGYNETIFPGSGAPAAKIGPAAVEFLDRQSKSPKQPFFVSVGITETHRAFPTDVPADEARYLRPPAPFPDTEVFRKDMAGYVELVKRVDMALGQILDKLEATGQRENTLIICTTDHGVAFPSMKNNLTDHGTGVLFILSGPGVPRGKVTDALVTQLDVFPTICEATGIAKPDWLTGDSLQPVLRGETEELRDAIFTESNYHGYAYHPFRCIRTHRWAYIEGFEDTEFTKFPRSDASPSDKTWTAAGWGRELAPKARLFDRLFDPNEVHNLASDPAHQSILAELKIRLHQHLKETQDPILQAPIPAPKGATI